MRKMWMRGGRSRDFDPVTLRQSAAIRRAIYSVEMLEQRVLLSDVSVAAVIKSVDYSQVGTGAPTSDHDYQFDTAVVETAANTVTSATVMPPGGSTLALTANSQDGVNQLESQHNDFSTQAAMDAAYPNGTYPLTIHASNDGTHALALGLTGDEYPAAPHITSYNALNGADPTQALSVTWDAMSNGTAGDYLQVGVSDHTGGVFGNLVLESPLPGQAGALSGTTTSFTIPAGTLQAGHQYQAWLEFIKFASKDTTDYPGVVAGGVYQSGGNVDFTTGAASTAGWVADAPIGTARDQFAAGVVDGKVYIFGGNAFGTGHNLNSTEMFDPTTGVWSNVADDNNYGGQGTEELTGASVNGKFYAISGYGGLNWVEVYDPNTNAWTSEAPNPAPVASATSAVYNGEIYLFGGYNDSTGTQVRSDTVEAYNPTTNSWRTVTQMPQALEGESVAVVGDSVYVIGGATFDASGNPNAITSDISRYDFLTNTWTTTGLAPMPVATVGTYDAAAPVIDGKIYVIGGIAGAIVDGVPDVSTLDSVDIYDTSTNSWSTGPSLPAPRNGEGVVAVGNTIYAIGGNDGSGGDDDPSDSDGIVSTVWSWQVSANLAPASLAGDTLVALKSSLGVGNNTSPGVQRLTFPTSGNTLAFENEIFPENDRAINYSYTMTGPSTATIVDATDNVTIELTFDTATSGTANYIFTTGGNFNAVFTLFTPPVQNFAPAGLAGNTATLNVAGGESDRFTTSGTTNIIFNPDNTFNVIVDGTPEASGTTSYTQAVGSGLDIAEIVNADNNGQTTYVYFVFTSTTGGSFYLTDANDSNNLTDFSYGTFNLSTPQLAPSSIAGDVSVGFETAGTGENTPPGFSRFDFAASGNTFTNEDFIYGEDGTQNYSYTVTGPSTATLVDTTRDISNLLTFTTPTSGTFHQINPEGNQDGMFILFTPPLQNLAPASIGGMTATLNFAGGGGTEFNTSGTETISLGSDGTFTGFFDGSVESTGNYSYTQAIGSVPGIAEVIATHNDTSYDYLVFTSATGGSFYETDANGANHLSDFSYGTFSIRSSAQLAFEQTPDGVTAGSIIGPAINVDVDDSDGNIVAADDSIVTLSIASGPAGATLSGTLSVEDIGGVATFDDLALDTPGDYTLLATDGSTAPATISFTVADPPSLSPGDGAAYSISAPSDTPQTLAVTAGIVTLSDDLSNSFFNYILSIAPGAEVITTEQQSISGLVISPGGKLDLTNADLVIDYGSSPDPTSTIAGEISSAYDSGKWDGLGVTSSTAAANSNFELGYSDDAVNHELVVSYNFAGDFNRDGTVNVLDFNALAANYGRSGKDFSQGDANYDSIVNLLDLNAIATNFGQSVFDLASPSLPIKSTKISPLARPAATQANLFGDLSILPGDASPRDTSGGIAAQLQVL